MRTHPSLRFLVALGATGLLVAACGGGDDSDDASGGSARGTLGVCTASPYEPFEFEGADGELTGFDIELVRAVADRMNRDVKLSNQEFEGIWLAPQAGTCDLVASAMTITPERTKLALFSEPYLDAKQSLLVRADNRQAFATLDRLAGRTIGVQAGTTGESYANENKPAGATVKSFTESSALFLALESGDLDAVLQDLPVNGYRTTQNPGLAVTQTFATDERYGFAVEKDDTELITGVNAALDAMRKDGSYDDLYTHWFGRPPA